MSKLAKRITSAAIAAVMSIGMVVSASAAECKTHYTFYRDLGIAYEQSAGSHEYIYEVRTEPNGNITYVYKKCTMRVIGQKYGYVCKYCGSVTQMVIKNTKLHSSCGA